MKQKLGQPLLGVNIQNPDMRKKCAETQDDEQRSRMTVILIILRSDSDPSENGLQSLCFNTYCCLLYSDSVLLSRLIQYPR